MANNSFLFILHAVVLLVVTVLFIVKAPVALRIGESRLKPIYILLLSVVVIYGMWLRFDYVSQRFKVFYVEYEIHNIVRMITGENDFSICTGGTLSECEEKQSPVYATGFPFMGAAAMKLTGSHTPSVLFTLNSVLGVLCIPVIFIMVMAATGSPRSSLFAAFAASILPLNVILSGNTTTETSDLLFLCIAFTFMFLYIRNNDVLSGVGLFSAIVFSVLVEPRNVYTAAFILVVLFAAGHRDVKRFAAALAGAALLIVLVFILPPVYMSVFSLPSGNYFDILKANMHFLVSNQFIPLYVSIPLVFAPAFLGHRCGVSRPLFFFFFVSIIVTSLFNFDLSMGDFPRFVLPAIIPIMLFFGITGDWVMESIKNVSIRNGGIALLLTVFLISSFNTSLVSLRYFVEAQDDFLAVSLPKAVGTCSVFSINPSIGMTYTENPSYLMDNLLDESFMKEHSECKVVVFEMECASSQKVICSKVFDRFAPQELYAENIFNYYNTIISLIPSVSPAEMPGDGTAL